MPVIINDFEVMVEPPRQSGSESQPSSELSPPMPESSQSLRPADIDQIIKHFQERRKRVWAD